VCGIGSRNRPRLGKKKKIAGSDMAEGGGGEGGGLGRLKKFPSSRIWKKKKKVGWDSAKRGGGRSIGWVKKKKRGGGIVSCRAKRARREKQNRRVPGEGRGS